MVVLGAAALVDGEGEGLEGGEKRGGGSGEAGNTGEEIAGMGGSSPHGGSLVIIKDNRVVVQARKHANK